MTERHGPVLLRATGVVKDYGHVRALDGAELEVRAGEIHALIGDNGAGKSTLIKVISGVVRPDRGELEFRGRRVRFDTPAAAREAGIETVYQDLSLAPSLDAGTNMFLGREIRRAGLLGRLRLLDKGQMRERADAHLKDLGIDLPSVRIPIERLSGGQRQAVAVARTAMWGQAMVILDEPTAALGARQTKLVLDLIRRTRDRGIAILFISHDLPQILDVADRITVLRLGRRVLEIERKAIDPGMLLQAMSGLELAQPSAGATA